jgi:two-component system, OmpR family, sensor histidine kinase SenX3
MWFVGALTAAIALVIGVWIGAWWQRARAGATWSRDPSGSTMRPDDVPALLSEAVDHLEIGVVVATAGEGIVYRNVAADRFKGTHVGLLVDGHLASIISAAQTGERAARVVELQGPPKRWLAIAADPTPDGGAVATIEDVSERVRTDEMRTDFVTNVSHELKTPVGAIAVLAEALMEEADPQVVRRLADHLVDESHRAVRTIDDLLKLSEIEAAPPADTPVDLSAVVRAAVGRGRAADGGRGIRIDVVGPGTPLHVRGDERQLVSAVGNLVENAVKYSLPGGTVQVGTAVVGRFVEISVTDEGVGIPGRDLGRVFERFYRVDKARSRDTGGTGLGLSIVRHVATNHGGEVLVTSEEGQGSTFVLRLPADRIVAAPRDGTGVETPVEVTRERVGSTGDTGA